MTGRPGPGLIQGGKMRGTGSLCILTPTIFKNAFDVYNFSTISNLFDSNVSLKHALSKICEQNASYLAKHSELKN